MNDYKFIIPLYSVIDRSMIFYLNETRNESPYETLMRVIMRLNLSSMTVVTVLKRCKLVLENLAKWCSKSGFKR